MDIIGYHFYVINEPPEALLERIARVRGIMAAYGLEDRPLWNTEAGWIITESGRSVDPRSAGFAANTKVLSQTEAAEYVARALIVGWTAGLGRFYWYAWDNYAMGLVEQDGRTLKPAADAFGQVETWLVGAQLTCDHPNDNGTWVCPVTRPHGGPGLVIWNPMRIASFQPSRIAAPTPPRCSCRMTTAAPWARASSPVPSVDPSSTTIASKRPSRGSLSRTRPIFPVSFRAGMTTATIGSNAGASSPAMVPVGNPPRVPTAAGAARPSVRRRRPGMR